MRLLLVLAVLAVALATAGGALARTVEDPADAPGKLDIRAATFSQHGSTLSFTITTWQPWTSADLYSRHVSREVCALIWTRSASSRTYDFSVCADVVVRHRKLVGSVFENGREEAPVSVGRAALIRPDATTLVLSFPARLIDSPHTLRWQIRSFYTHFDFTSLAREHLS